MVLVYAFLLVPMVVLAVMSLNSAKYGVFPLSGFTLDWYSKLLDDAALLASLRFSFQVAVATVATAVPLGLMAAYGLVRFEFRGKPLFRAVILVPLMIPGLLAGIAMLTLFHLAGVESSLVTVWLAHTALAIPYTTLILAARLQGLDRSFGEAAASLGATPANAFRRVTLPLLGPGLIGAALLAFTISFGEVVVTYFVSGFNQTLPLNIYSQLKTGLTPAVNAISSIVVLVGLACGAVATRLSRN
ncbi:MAG: ABC transporter permease [Nocardioidaceae bacterium]